MARSILRKVGGSVMLTVPPSILDDLDLKPGTALSLVVDDGRLIVAPEPRPRYTLDQLLAEFDPDAPISPEDSEWLDSLTASRELL